MVYTSSCIDISATKFIHNKMPTLRKIIVRQSWLMAVVVFALLVQIQQTLACDMMVDTSAPVGDHCYKHDTGEKPAGKTMPPLCDFSKVLSVKAVHCYDGHEAAINQQLWGKLNPDFHPVIILVRPQDILPSPDLTALFFVQDRKSSQPGTRTYLSTRRLRI